MRPVLALLLAILPMSASADPDFPELMNRLDRIRQEAGVAGLVLVVADSEGLVFAEGGGVEDWNSGRPMTPRSLIRIGSVTKSFTGLAFAALEADGLIDLGAPIRSHLAEPPFDNPWWKTHPVTLAQLLEHSAGLTDMSRREFDHNQPLALAEALAVDPESRTLQWPPGLHSSYSNSGAGVAAFVMERITGRDFEAWVHSRLLDPLGMSSAGFVLDHAEAARLATGYDRDGRTPIPYWHTLYRPFGGLNLEPLDMVKWLQLWLNDGRIDSREILPAATIHRAERPETSLAARGGLTFGYGLGNYASIHDGFVFHGHGGDADGYLSRFGYSRELGVGYFLVINAFQNRTLRRMRDVVIEALIDGREPTFQPGVPQPAEHLEALTGRYRSVTWRFEGQVPETVAVRLRNGRLLLSRGDRDQHLIPLSRWQFRRPFEPVATTAFIRHQGALYLQGPFGNFRRQP